MNSTFSSGAPTFPTGSQIQTFIRPLSGQNSKLIPDHEDILQSRIRGIDILIFGDIKAGKRTFMEKFTGKDLSTQGKIS